MTVGSGARAYGPTPPGPEGSNGKSFRSVPPGCLIRDGCLDTAWFDVIDEGCTAVFFYLWSSPGVITLKSISLFMLSQLFTFYSFSHLILN